MIRSLFLLALAVVGAVAVLWVFQRRLIYLPMDRSVPRADRVLPGAEEMRFSTPDGLELNGWFLAAEDPSATILVFNGNAGNRAGRAPLADALRRRGFSVMLFDYRGYADNPGSPSEEGLAEDARGALAHLRSQPEVDPGRIVYFGESLGSAVAIGLATEEPPAAMVLRSPFTSLADVGRIHYPYLPVSLLLWDRYPSSERIRTLEVPVLVVAGERDGIVPASQSIRLYEEAPGPKRLVVLESVDHNDFELFAGDRLLAEVEAFLAEFLGG